MIGNHKGYTLIEVIVAIGIFSAIIAAPSGLFIGSLKSQQAVLASQELLDNVSYVMEYLSKAVRMAKKDDLGGINCLDGDKVNYELGESAFSESEYDEFRLRDYNNVCRTFGVVAVGDVNRIYVTGAGDVLSGYVLRDWLTSANIDIVEFKVVPSLSWSQENEEQPRVTIFLKARYAKGSIRPEISIQTTISQRDLDVRY